MPVDKLVYNNKRSLIKILEQVENEIPNNGSEIGSITI